MPHIKLFDGTKDPKFGNALIKSFAEIAKYQEMIVSPKPGSTDIKRFEIVKEAEKKAYDSGRKQVNYTTLLEEISNHPSVNVFGRNTFTLTERDLYAPDLNWCFGVVLPDSVGGKHLIMSTYRLQDLETLAHVATHELGHIYGAAQQGRRNTEQNLGSHCTNLCVMQQKLTIPDMTAHAKKLASRRDKFCYDCSIELRAYEGH